MDIVGLKWRDVPQDEEHSDRHHGDYFSGKILQ
jgi:hypothetical protein